ncbi:MAG: GNAT family N-acetyltransferase [Spirochaetales bacterium]
MANQPTLKTRRFELRPFHLSDAGRVKELCGDWRIADTTLHIPHPYEDGMAEEWIDTHAPKWSEGVEATFAVTDPHEREVIGAVGLRIENAHARGELGYWIGVPYWGQGIATEAAGAVLRFAFENLGLNRVYATHVPRNPASGRVMTKLGMRREGCLRSHAFSRGRYEDLIHYGIIAEDRRAPDG